jgi:hypothetical protein
METGLATAVAMETLTASVSAKELEMGLGSAKPKVWVMVKAMGSEWAG